MPRPSCGGTVRPGACCCRESSSISPRKLGSSFRWATGCYGKRAGNWRNGAGQRWPDLVVTVNVSGRQLGRSELADTVTSALAETELQPNALHIEFTESTLIKATPSTLAELEALRGLGFISVSTTSAPATPRSAYLQRLPVDFVKIDGSFVAEIDERQADHAIVQAVVGLGQALGLQVIAEGVETEAQQTALQVMGCRLRQGWRLGYPQAAATFEGLLATTASR